MKAKLMQDLDENERLKFHGSELYRLMTRQWNHTETFINYNKEYFGTDYIDYSLVVFESEEFYIGFWSYSSNDIISFFNQPVSIININLSSKQLNLAFISLIDKISELKIEKGLTKLLFFQNPYITSLYINNILSTEVAQESYIDLYQSADMLKMNVRKSYKSLINWGLSNLKTVLISKNNLDKILFDSFKNFHIQVAGRQTRSDYSWDLQYDAILNDDAFLLLGYLDDRLVSGAYIIYGSESAYYGVAVNDRQLMKQNIPVGHSILYSSILNAKNIGIKTFKLGVIDNKHEDKITQINMYKKGFTNTVNTVVKLLVEL